MEKNLIYNTLTENAAMENTENVAMENAAMENNVVGRDDNMLDLDKSMLGVRREQIKGLPLSDTTAGLIAGISLFDEINVEVNEAIDSLYGGDDIVTDDKNELEEDLVCAYTSYLRVIKKLLVLSIHENLNSWPMNKL